MLGGLWKNQEYQIAGWFTNESRIANCWVVYERIENTNLLGGLRINQEYQIAGWFTKESRIPNCWVVYERIKNTKLLGGQRKNQEYQIAGWFTNESRIANCWVVYEGIKNTKLLGGLWMNQEYQFCFVLSVCTIIYIQKWKKKTLGVLIITENNTCRGLFLSEISLSFCLNIPLNNHGINWLLCFFFTMLWVQIFW